MTFLDFVESIEDCGWVSINDPDKRNIYLFWKELFHDSIFNECLIHDIFYACSVLEEIDFDIMNSDAAKKVKIHQICYKIISETSIWEESGELETDDQKNILIRLKKIKSAINQIKKILCKEMELLDSTTPTIYNHVWSVLHDIEINYHYKSNWE